MTCCVMVLPQDVMEDILSRLPVKSVQRLRYLSKLWDSLISAQSFTRLHLRRVLESRKVRSEKILMSSGSLPIRVLDHEIGSSFADEVAISWLDFPRKISECFSIVVGSCHGLICLTLDYGNDNKDFFLWNPTTGNYKNLSYPYFLIPNNDPIGFGFDYDYAFGFGYDSFSDDYKIFLGLRISCHKTHSKEDKVVIFSTREDCWRSIQLPPNYTLPLFGRHSLLRCGSFVNGALNWLVHEDGDKVYTVIAFDLKTETFFELPMPDKIDKDAHYVHRYALGTGLGIFEGKLCLSTIKKGCSLESYNTSYVVKFWVMNEYGQSWSRLPIAPLQSASWGHIPLCPSKDNQIILSNQWKLTRIDAEGRKLEDYSICQCGPHEKGSTWICVCEAITYLESLVWPFVKGTCIEEKEECA